MFPKTAVKVTQPVAKFQLPKVQIIHKLRILLKLDSIFITNFIAKAGILKEL